MDNKKQKQQHQDDADRTSDKKEVTDHEKTATSSTSYQRQFVYHPDVCSICMENVCMLDESTFGIYTCCGKVIHTMCANDLRSSNLSDAIKAICPWCRAKNAYKVGSTTGVLRLFEWSQKKKPWALEMLADRYRQGICVTQSDKKAADHYKISADLGHPSAQYHIGIMYLDGKGVTQSETLAIKYLTLSAEQGDPDAQFNLGCMHADGAAEEQSFDSRRYMLATAKVWFEKAVAQGYRDAVEALIEVNKDLQSITTSSTVTDNNSSADNSINSETTNTTETKNEEQLVSLPVNEQCVVPDTAHRKRSYSMMALAARKQIAAGKEIAEMDATIPINATNDSFETQEETKNANDIEAIRPKNSSLRDVAEVDLVEDKVAEDAVDVLDVLDVLVEVAEDDVSKEFIFNLPYGFARFWAMFLIAMVIIEMFFIYQFLFNSDEHFSMQALRFFASPTQTILNLVVHSQSLSLVLHIAAVPVDIYMGFILFSLDPKCIDIKRVRKLNLRYIL